MVVHRDVQGAAYVGDRAGHLDVGAAGGGVPAGVIVDLSAFSEIDMIINMLQ
jgi:hypothetical protein